MRAFLPPLLSVCLLASLPLTAQGRPPRPAPPQPVEPVQEPEPTGQIRTGAEGFVLPAGTFALTQLIEAAASYLQRNILWNPGEVQAVGSTLFAFQKELALDAHGCEEVLCQLLHVKGFVLLTVDADKGIYEVVFMGGQRRAEIATNAPRRTPEEILRRPRLKQYVVTEVRLEHINANSATNSLRPFFGQQHQGPAPALTFGTAGTSSTLLVSGFQDQVAQVIRMLQACDVPAPEVPPEVTERIARLERTVKQLQEQAAPSKPQEK